MSNDFNPYKAPETYTEASNEVVTKTRPAFLAVIALGLLLIPAVFYLLSGFSMTFAAIVAVMAGCSTVTMSFVLPDHLFPHHSTFIFNREGLEYLDFSTHVFIPWKLVMGYRADHLHIMVRAKGVFASFQVKRTHPQSTELIQQLVSHEIQCYTSTTPQPPNSGV